MAHESRPPIGAVRARVRPFRRRKPRIRRVALKASAEISHLEKVCFQSLAVAA
jgi:hypothetical protein